ILKRIFTHLSDHCEKRFAKENFTCGSSFHPKRDVSGMEKFLKKSGKLEWRSNSRDKCPAFIPIRKSK
ncbi:MAG: hypothetical protein ACP5QS_03070, partial [bacterium]